MEKSQTSIVLGYVNYHCEDEILSSLVNVPEYVQIYVCDNSSTMPKDDRYVVIRPGKNLGLYNGFDFILRYLVDIEKTYNWFLASNPDIIYSNEFFNLLSIYSISHEIIAPKILSELSGHNQNPQIKNRPSRNKMKLLSIIWSNKILANLYQLMSLMKRRFFRMESSNLVITDIYCPHGSLVIFNSNYCKNFGLEHPTFLFGETIQIAETARRNNIRIRYDSSLEVRHKEHSTTSFWRSGDVLKYQGESAVYFYEKYWR